MLFFHPPPLPTRLLQGEGSRNKSRQVNTNYIRWLTVFLSHASLLTASSLLYSICNKLCVLNFAVLYSDLLHYYSSIYLSTRFLPTNSDSASCRTKGGAALNKNCYGKPYIKNRVLKPPSLHKIQIEQTSYTVKSPHRTTMRACSFYSYLPCIRTQHTSTT